MECTRGSKVGHARGSTLGYDSGFTAGLDRRSTVDHVEGSRVVSRPRLRF